MTSSAHGRPRWDREHVVQAVVDGGREQARETRDDHPRNAVEPQSGVCAKRPSPPYSSKTTVAITRRVAFLHHEQFETLVARRAAARPLVIYFGLSLVFSLYTIQTDHSARRAFVREVNARLRAAAEAATGRYERGSAH